MPLVLLIQPDISLVQPQAAAYISKVVQKGPKLCKSHHWNQTLVY